MGCSEAFAAAKGLLLPLLSLEGDAEAGSLVRSTGTERPERPIRMTMAKGSGKTLRRPGFGLYKKAICVIILGAHGVKRAKAGSCNDARLKQLLKEEGMRNGGCRSGSFCIALPVSAQRIFSGLLLSLSGVAHFAAAGQWVGEVI